jgi:hypothetical protein
MKRHSPWHGLADVDVRTVAAWLPEQGGGRSWGVLTCAGAAMGRHGA